MARLAIPRPAGRGVAGSSPARRTLALAGIAHALHDGYTDAIYVLLPIWQIEFGLGYAALALLRGLHAAAMATLQIPAGRLAERLGGRTVLVSGTALAALGYALAGASAGTIGLCAALMLSGLGSSAQHPIASALIARAYGAASRGPLGAYNFCGDLGKAVTPALLSMLLTLMPWRASLWLVALAGAVVAVLVALLLPPVATGAAPEAAHATGPVGGGRGGFPLLLAIGVLDTGARMGLLTFLPFLLKAKGAAPPTIGLALALVFLGGAAGKFACGWLGDRVGVLRTTLLTEGGTAAGILAVVLLPLLPVRLLLPALGAVLNGTSSVLYGTVPDLAPADRTERAFALFYTGVIGAGALFPMLYGGLGDLAGPVAASVATALTALATFPLALTHHLPPSRIRS